MSAETVPDLESRLRSLRIIVVMLVLGLLTFLGIVVGLRAQGDQPPPPETPFFTYVGLAFVPAALGMALLFPRLAASGLRRQVSKETGPGSPAGAAAPTTAGRLLGLYQTRLILRAAPLEGAANLLLIAYLLEGSPLALGLAGVLAVAIAALFPTRTGVESWLEQQRGLIDQEG